MAIRSAGILLYRMTASGLEIWLAHMGGPFWAKKDAGAWSIPKGEFLEDEDALAAALREFGEEIGAPAPTVEYTRLGDFRQSSGKVVTAFAAETDFAVEKIASNTFPLEWPPRSGRIQEFPEIDDARWFPIAEARVKVVKGQLAILDAVDRRASVD
jgi:predicted NUDIX family NTP pyrophosphohydrolase